MEDYTDLERYQDVPGQLPMLQAYSHILYFFPSPKDTTRQQIVQAVEQAVTKVRHAVPWMDARLVCRGKTENKSGVYSVTRCSPPTLAIDVNDATSTHPSYDEIQSRRGPLSLIHTDQLTSTPGYPAKINLDSEENPAHVIQVQLSFISGGLVLDMALAHNLGDAGGHFGMVKMIATAMRGEEFDEHLLAAANYDRRGSIKLLGPEEPLLDHSHHLRAPVQNAAAMPLAAKSPPATYHVFRFTKANMASLKALGTPPPDSPTPFVSTDDVVCALCWQRMVKTRVHALPSETKSRFTRQIDGRRLVGLPAAYMGAVTHTASAWLTFGELVSKPLHFVAAHLRGRLNEANTLYHLRSFATFIAREPDKARITYAGEFDPRTDVGCSSIRGLPDVFPAFGCLGKPSMIRRPTSVPFASTVVLFPGTEDGDCDAIVGLTDAEFELLQMDDLWTRYTEYIG